MPLFLGKDGFWTAGYTRLRFEDIKKRDVVRFIQDQRYAVVADDSLSAILIGPEDNRSEPARSLPGNNRRGKTESVPACNAKSKYIHIQILYSLYPFVLIRR